MLSRLELTNFKSLVNAKINFRRLTLLMGPNNSGKSSVFQALGFIKQSLNQNTFITQGAYATLGSFVDVVFRNERKRKIEVSCYIALNEQELSEISAALGVSSQFNDFALNEIGVTWTFSPTRGWEMSCLNDAKGEKIVCGGSYELFKPSQKDKIQGLVSEVGVSNLFPSVTSGQQSVVMALQNVISLVSKGIKERLESKLFYLMTRRGIQHREQGIGTSRPYNVGPYGENTVPILAFIRDDPEFEYLINKINEWAERFGFERVFSRIVGGNRHALTLTDKIFRIHSNVMDIGYGTNQLLPVILQCFYAPPPSLILIEEPEMHLHPMMQADIVDLFIDVLNYGNRVAIETHSEHILARLQRRVAEGAIRPEDVVINYFEKKKDGTEVTEIEIDETGRLKKELPGFFEEDFNEALERMRVTMKKLGGKTTDNF